VQHPTVLSNRENRTSGKQGLHWTGRVWAAADRHRIAGTVGSHAGTSSLDRSAEGAIPSDGRLPEHSPFARKHACRIDCRPRAASVGLDNYTQGGAHHVMSSNNYRETSNAPREHVGQNIAVRLRNAA